MTRLCFARARIAQAGGLEKAADKNWRQALMGMPLEDRKGPSDARMQPVNPLGWNIS
jgi:hypothetical protein